MVSGIEFHIFTPYTFIEDALTLELHGKGCIMLPSKSVHVYSWLVKK